MKKRIQFFVLAILATCSIAAVTTGPVRSTAGGGSGIPTLNGTGTNTTFNSNTNSYPATFNGASSVVGSLLAYSANGTFYIDSNNIVHITGGTGTGETERVTFNPQVGSSVITGTNTAGFFVGNGSLLTGISGAGIPILNGNGTNTVITNFTANGAILQNVTGIVIKGKQPDSVTGTNNGIDGQSVTIQGAKGGGSQAGSVSTGGSLYLYSALGGDDTNGNTGNSGLVVISDTNQTTKITLNPNTQVIDLLAPDHVNISDSLITPNVYVTDFIDVNSGNFHVDSGGAATAATIESVGTLYADVGISSYGGAFLVNSGGIAVADNGLVRTDGAGTLSSVNLTVTNYTKVLGSTVTNYNGTNSLNTNGNYSATLEVRYVLVAAVAGAATLTFTNLCANDPLGNVVWPLGDGALTGLRTTNTFTHRLRPNEVWKLYDTSGTGASAYVIGNPITAP